MTKSFWHLVLSSFLKVGVVVCMVGAFALAIILWYIKPDVTVPIGIILPILIVCLLFILTFANVAYKTFSRFKHPLPKVIAGRKPPTYLSDTKALCLLEPSEFFSHNMLVSFYFIDEDNFERLIGIGEVINIQEDSKIQVLLRFPTPGHEEKIASLIKNDRTILHKLLVKPSIPRNYMGNHIYERRQNE